MENRDFVLLAVAAGESKALTPVQLQKSLFLIKEGLSKAGAAEMPSYDFEPYLYGPFDIDVYKDAELLHEEGTVLRFRSRSGSLVETMVTPTGLAQARSLEEGLPAHVVAWLHETVAWVQSQSFRELVGSIYKQYPEYRKDSVF